MNQPFNENSTHQDNHLSQEMELKLTLLEGEMTHSTYKSYDKDVYVCDIDSDNNLITVMSCDNSIFNETLTDVSLISINDFMKQNNL